MKELLAPFFEISRKPWFVFGNGILLFLLLNGIVSTGHCKIDLSRSGRFEVTKSTKKVLNDLDAVLYIDAFYSSQIPGEYKARLELTKGLLEEIASLGKDKVVLRFYDPDSSAEDSRKASESGIEPQILERTARDSASVKQAYLGLVLTLGNRTEVLSLAFFTEQLEYQILTAVRNMLRPDKDSSIGILKTAGSLSLSENGSAKDRITLFVKQALTSEYGPISEIHSDNDPIPEEVDLIFWIGAGQIDEETIWKLDQFLLKGGNLIVLAKSMEFQMDSPGGGFGLLAGDLGAGLAQKNPNASDMVRVLEHYGIQIHSDIVLEPDDSLPMGPLIEVEPGVLGRYPYPPWIVSNRNSKTLNQESPYTRDQGSLLIPWSSSLEILQDKQKDILYTRLAFSGPDSESRGEPVSLGEKQILSIPIQANGGPFTLGLVAEGKFDSYFSKETIPSKTNGKVFLSRTPESKTSRILVFGSPYIVSDLLAYPDFREIFKNSNIPFLLNTIDLMRGENDLIQTRSKQSAILKMKTLPLGLETAISLVNLFGVPLLLCLYAFRRLRSRSQLQ